jgi:hypothetical protein
VGTVAGGYGVPGYTGDDSAIVYSRGSDTPTEFSLVRQPLADDRMTPRGSPSPWMDNADYGVIYRRGEFVGPRGCAADCDGDSTVRIDELVRAVNIALGGLPLAQCAAADSDGDGRVAINELILAVNAALAAC